MEEGNLAILVDAKTEYTKQLVNILKGSMYQGIKKLYKESKEAEASSNAAKQKTSSSAKSNKNVEVEEADFEEVK